MESTTIAPHPLTEFTRYYFPSLDNFARNVAIHAASERADGYYLASLDNLASLVADCSARHGFRTEKSNILAKLMLLVTEVSEADEAYVRGDMDGFGEELADVQIRLLDIASCLSVRLAHAVSVKMAQYCEKDDFPYDTNCGECDEERGLLELVNQVSWCAEYARKEDWDLFELAIATVQIYLFNLVGSFPTLNGKHAFNVALKMATNERRPYRHGKTNPEE